MTQYDNDPLADSDGGSSGNPIRTNRQAPGSRFALRVEDIGDVMTGDYGDYVLITGELLNQVDCLGGTADEPEPAPEVGDTVSYLVGNWVEADSDKKPRHIQEEIQKAVRKATKRPGFVRPGDVLHVKFVELLMTKANGSKYPKGKEFGRHVVLVQRESDTDPLANATGHENDVPF